MSAVLGLIWRVPRWLWGGLAVLALLWLAYSWAHERGQRSRDKEVAAMAQERNAAKASVATLEAAVTRQNAAARLAEARAKSAQDMAQNAARMTQERDRALAGVKRRLDAAARPVGAVAGCEVPGAVREAWEAM